MDDRPSGPWNRPRITGLLVGAVILGGIRRIGRVAARIVPLRFLVYLSGALLICLFNLERVP